MLKELTSPCFVLIEQLTLRLSFSFSSSHIFTHSYSRSRLSFSFMLARSLSCQIYVVLVETRGLISVYFHAPLGGSRGGGCEVELLFHTQTSPSRVQSQSVRCGWFPVLIQKQRHGGNFKLYDTDGN